MSLHCQAWASVWTHRSCRRAPALAGLPGWEKTHRQEAGTACKGGGSAWGIVGAEGRHGTWPLVSLYSRDACREQAST